LKFIYDSENIKTHGIFLSQQSGIAGKSNYQIDYHKGYILVYIHNVDYSKEKIQIAVDIIDNLSMKIEEFTEGEDINISKDILEDINNEYQDLILADFYYPGSYYSYLSETPLNGTPNLDALQIICTKYKARIVHLDIYSDKKDPYDPTALPVVRCEKIKENKEPLALEDCFNIIKQNAWKDSPYPFFLYLNLHFSPENESIYVKIYYSLLKFFSQQLMDKKYSFSGRNGLFPISMALMKECLHKIIIITNIYPTKTLLDELINTTTNNLNDVFNFTE
jgi:hypothetical protein